MTNLEYAKTRVAALIQQVKATEKQIAKSRKAIDKEQQKLDAALIELPRQQEQLQLYQAYIEAIETDEILKEAA